ncbi:hypothetical protein NQ317_012975 [Molorchus minor]|uniref:SWIM-type domain-containing protein n=1 Tax=Molorchus minor TaxID=1323400 RepID=A0ABQ9JFA5_9CUCU|nr:hypothetical protein NQ317_012975 [Molorchus minor]
MPKVEISISDILEYLGEKVRPLKEGEAVFKAGHIILCGLDATEPHNIKSLCLQTSRLSQPPHEIKINLSSPWVCECTCKAGLSGFCKHIVASLIYINRTEDLEYVSCTDIQQKWGKEKKGVEELYSVIPFTSFCHPIKKKKFNFKTNDDINQKNFNLLVSGLEYHVTLKKIICHMNKGQFLKKLQIIVPDIQPCCRSILDQLFKTDVLEVACCTMQGSDAWNKERQLRITGSTCYSLYTYGRGHTVDWESHAKKFFSPKGFKNKFTEHGLKYEKEAIKAFKERNYSHIITPSLVIAKSLPWLAFSPDGVIFEGGVPTSLLEIKCPYIGKEQGPEVFIKYCDYLEIVNYKPQLKVHHQYYGQVQFGMALLNLKKLISLFIPLFQKVI